MKWCDYCGAQLPDNASSCYVCGHRFDQAMYPVNTQNSLPGQMPNSSSGSAVKGTLSIVFGVLSLLLFIGIVPLSILMFADKNRTVDSSFTYATVLYSVGAFAGLFLGIISIVLGVSGRNSARRRNARSGASTAGMICGIVGTVFNCLHVFGVCSVGIVYALYQAS